MRATRYIVLAGLAVGLALTTGLSATAASAQDTGAEMRPAGPPAADPAMGGDTITVAVGVASVPSYEGSDNNNFIPAALVRGSYHGFSFYTRGAQLFVDLVPDAPGPVVDFEAGPVVSVNFNRSRRKGVDDFQVEALGTRKVALELGGYVGIGKTGVLTSDYDTLSANVSYIHDVSGIHDSYVVTPEINYGTPLSRKAYVGLSANASYVGGGYAQTYVGVDAAGALRSGLPGFSAGKGWKSYSISGLASYALTGDLLGGLSAVGGVSYSRLLNDYRRSPVTSIAGDPDQWIGAIGLAYTF